MALKSYSCTNSQKITYNGSNKFTIGSISSATTCTITYTAVTKDFAYTAAAQSYTVPYTGYYLLTAYGAQGAGSGGKNSIVSGATSVKNNSGVNASNGKVSLTYYKENL